MAVQDAPSIETPLYNAKDAPKWTPKMSLFMIRSKSLTSTAILSKSLSNSNLQTSNRQSFQEDQKPATHRQFHYRAVSLSMRDESPAAVSARPNLEYQVKPSKPTKRSHGYGLLGTALLKHPNLPLGTLYSKSQAIDLSDFCASLSQGERSKHLNSETRTGTMLDLEMSSFNGVPKEDSALPVLKGHKKQPSDLSFIDLSKQIVFKRTKAAIVRTHRRTKTTMTGGLDLQSQDSCARSIERVDDPWEGLESTVKLLTYT